MDFFVPATLPINEGPFGAPFRICTAYVRFTAFPNVPYFKSYRLLIILYEAETEICEKVDVLKKKNVNHHRLST